MSRFKDESGSALIEIALLIPFIVMLLLGAMDFGRAWYVKLEVDAAAQAGALYGVQSPSDISGMNAAALLDAPDILSLQATSTYGSECSDGTSPVPLAVTTPTCSANSTDYVQVTTTATYKTLLTYPGFAPSISMTGVSRMRTTF